MANLFRKPRLLLIVAGFIVLVFTIILIIFVQDRKSQKYSTPDLIQLAFAKGEITEEERLLYLAYALADSEKLPIRYHGKAPWSGTMIGLELYETVNSKERMCKLSLFAQSELQRVLKTEGVSCDK